MSWRVTTEDSTSPPSSEKIGVALTRAVTLRPSGTRRMISSRRTVSPALSSSARDHSPRDISCPSARRKIRTLRRPSRRLIGVPKAVDDPSRLPVQRDRDSGLGVEDGDTDWRGLDQGLQVVLGLPFVPIPTGVGDDQCGLGGEHDQGLLVLPGELPAGFLDRHVDAADALAEVMDRGRHEGDERADRPAGR